MSNMQQTPDGRWVPAEPIGWREEHGPLARLVLWIRGVGHCGKPGRDGTYQPGEAPHRGES